MVTNLPWNAGDAGSIPGKGSKIPHSLEQLKPTQPNNEIILFKLMVVLNKKILFAYNPLATTTHLLQGDNRPQRNLKVAKYVCKDPDSTARGNSRPWGASSHQTDISELLTSARLCTGCAVRSRADSLWPNASDTQ